VNRQLAARALCAALASGAAWSGPAAASNAPGDVDLSSSPSRPLLWAPAPAIGPGDLTQPVDLDQRLAGRLVDLEPELGPALDAARARASARSEALPLGGFEAMIPQARTATGRALVMALEARARLTLADDLDASGRSRAYAGSLELHQAQLANDDPATRCLLALAAGTADAKAGLFTQGLATYRSAHCDAPADQARAALAAMLMEASIARRNDAERALASGNFSVLPASDRAFAIAALGDLLVARADFAGAAARYTEAARTVAGTVPLAIQARAAEALRLGGDRAGAVAAFRRAQSQAGDASHDGVVESWLALRLAAMALDGGPLNVASDQLMRAGDGDEARLRRADARLATVTAPHSPERDDVGAEYRRLAREAKSPWVVEEASFKTAWLALVEDRFGDARDGFAEFRELHPASALRPSASRGVDLSLERLVADLASRRDALGLARLVARDRRLLSASAAPMSLWLQVGWALESLGLTSEAEALYQRARALFAASDRACAGELAFRLAGISVQRDDLAAARAALGRDLDGRTLDLFRVLRPGPSPSTECRPEPLVHLARDGATAAAAAGQALERGDCDAARAHLEGAGAHQQDLPADRVAEVDRRCGAPHEALARVTSAPSDPNAGNDALAIALLAADALGQGENEPAMPSIARPEGVWARWSQARTADRSLRSALAEAGLGPVQPNPVPPATRAVQTAAPAETQP